MSATDPMTHPNAVVSAEHRRLAAAVASYGEGAAPFDALMRGYMMRAFSPWFTDGACLQVGCAHGDQTSLLLERFDDLTVLEPDPTFVAHTRKRLGDRVVFIEALLEDYQTDRRFDTIVFSHVLEHVADPVAALRRLGALLSPGGRLYVVVPNAEAPSRRIAVKMGLFSHLEGLSAADEAAGHRRVYRLDTLQRDVAAAGLNAEQSGGIFYKPLANFQFNALIGGPLISDDFLEACYALGQERPTECASIFVVARTAG
jgi:2-polyprenyl-3-methyl-5-hydroxy-6-metoxy-1,4-benzoquinol methylase